MEEKPEFATTKQYKTSDLIKRIKVSEQKDKDKKGNIRSTYESISPSCEIFIHLGASPILLLLFMEK